MNVEYNTFLNKRPVFNTVYEQNWKSLYAFAFNILRDKESAEDIIQEIFIDFWIRMDDTKIQSYTAYLFQTVKNQCAKTIRYKKLTTFELNILDESLQLVEEEITELTKEHLIEEVSKKTHKISPEKCRAIFMLRLYETMSIKDIADYKKLLIEQTKYSDLVVHKLANGETLASLREYILARIHNNRSTRLVCEIKPSEYTERPENSMINKGVLKIKAIKENYNSSDYTSTKISSQDKFSFQYGKVEIRAKLPSGGGVWPALWMIGSNIKSLAWPTCGEIDILEYSGNNTVTTALHHPGHSGGNPNSGKIKIENAENEFHIHKLDWTKSSKKMYVDNLLFFNFKNSKALLFNQDYLFIFNCAIGGTYGGTINPNFISSEFEIDYVRVYQ